MMRKLSGGKTLIVQTQDPKVSLDRFDLVIPPEHDAVTGPNVFPILGSPVWFSAQRIADAKTSFAHLVKAEGQKVLVSLGGDSRTHTFTEARAAAIEADLRKLSSGRTFWITVSAARLKPSAIASARSLASLARCSGRTNSGTGQIPMLPSCRSATPRW
jgi:mitochondrial fission protein ELM1